MATTQQSIDVHVPVHTAYNQWTQFESFPQFMEGVESVQQVDDKHLHWKAKVGGKVQEWDAEITEQIPDQKIAWRSISGAPNGGVVTFNYLGPNETRVLLSIDYEPQGVAESAGAALGFMDRQVKGDLERFKTFIESRGQETGAWRGTIEDHPELGTRS
ncbi:MAG TPA: SRPBCC family protein [Ktedonobacterales bacterium]